MHRRCWPPIGVFATFGRTAACSPASQGWRCQRGGQANFHIRCARRLRPPPLPCSPGPSLTAGSRTGGTATVDPIAQAASSDSGDAVPAATSSDDGQGAAGGAEESGITITDLPGSSGGAAHGQRVCVGWGVGGGVGELSPSGGAAPGRRRQGSWGSPRRGQPGRMGRGAIPWCSPAGCAYACSAPAGVRHAWTSLPSPHPRCPAIFFAPPGLALGCPPPPPAPAPSHHTPTPTHTPCRTVFAGHQGSDAVRAQQRHRARVAPLPVCHPRAEPTDHGAQRRGQDQHTAVRAPRVLPRC